MATTDRQQFLTLLDQQREEITPLLPKYLDAERFIVNARTVLSNRELYVDKDTRKGLAVSINSLVDCVLDAARRGLEIGGPHKHCAVVAFKSTAVLIVQWQGKAFLWSKAGAIRKLFAEVVYDGDEFKIARGSDDKIIHVPDIDTPRSPKWLNDQANVRGAYAIATLWSGEKVTSWVSRSNIARVMEFVRRKNNGSLGFGWVDWYPEMCKKTAVHRLDGVIQPPPDASEEQLKIWALAAKNRDEDDDAIDAESRVVDPEDEDMPHGDDPGAGAKTQTATKTDAGQAANGSASSDHLNLKRDDPAAASGTDGDRLINEEEKAEMTTLRMKARLDYSEFIEVVKQASDGAVLDPQKLTASLLPKVRKSLIGMTPADA